MSWTYRFELKPERDPEVFRKEFLETMFAEWMRGVLEIGRSTN